MWLAIVFKRRLFVARRRCEPVRDLTVISSRWVELSWVLLLLFDSLACRVHHYGEWYLASDSEDAGVSVSSLDSTALCGLCCWIVSLRCLPYTTRSTATYRVHTRTCAFPNSSLPVIIWLAYGTVNWTAANRRVCILIAVRAAVLFLMIKMLLVAFLMAN